MKQALAFARSRLPLLALGWVAVAVTPAGAAPGCEAPAPDPSVRPSSSRVGRAIVPTPPGPRFEIPEAWVEWHGKYANNLHLSAEALDAVRHGAGDWDTEYAAVTNAVVPVERCTAHVGGDGWGRRAGGFSDLQVRVCVLADDPDAIEGRIATAGLEAAERLAPDARLEREDGAAWSSTRIRYTVSYGDYGGTANVEFRLRDFGASTVVVVGMYADGWDRRSELDRLVETVCWMSKAGECCTF